MKNFRKPNAQSAKTTTSFSINLVHFLFARSWGLNKKLKPDWIAAIGKSKMYQKVETEH